MTGKHSRDADLVEDGMGNNPEFPGQVRDEKGIEGIGSVYDQQRPSLSCRAKAGQQTEGKCGIVAGKNHRTSVDFWKMNGQLV
jgi:hypothetical protein